MGFAGRAALLCALAVGVLGAAPSASSPLDLPQVLEHMRAANGLQFGTHISSTSTRRNADGTADQVRLDSDGLRFSLQRCEGDVCFGSYFDGDRLYSVNMNGTALPGSQKTEVYLRGYRTVVSGAFLSPDFEQNGGHIRDGGEVSLGGPVYRKLIVENVDATPMDVFVDPQTWLVAVSRDVNGDATVEFRDYRRVGSLRLPFELDQNDKTMTSYDSRAIVTQPFAPPQGLKPVFDTARIAMPMDPGSETPVGTCTLGGVQVRCLIDTGNSGLSMSLELAEQLHASAIGGFVVAGLGRYATEVVRAGPLHVGSVTFPQADYVVLNDIHNYGYDVILGADLLANTSVTIDYASHQVWFGETAPDAASSVGLSFENFVPVLAVKLGTLTTDLALDTGDQSTINLAFDYYNQHSDLFKATQMQPVSGVGGSSIEMIGQIPQVQVGNYEVEAQNIGATRMLRGTAHGHLGAGFLAHFRVILDYAKSRVFFIKRPDDASVKPTKT